MQNNIIVVDFRDSANVQHCKTMYVNGVQTNTYHYTPENKYYNFSTDDAAITERNLKIAELIKTGVISSGNWDMWDVCTHTEVVIKNLKRAKTSTPYTNHIQSRSGYYEGISKEKEEEIIKELEGTTIQTQLIKQIVNNNISHQVAIVFGVGCYSLYFV